MDLASRLRRWPFRFGQPTRSDGGFPELRLQRSCFLFFGLANVRRHWFGPVQALDFTGPGNFNTPWANLTPAQQAGVIMAVTGAANGECE